MIDKEILIVMVAWGIFLLGALIYAISSILLVIRDNRHTKRKGGDTK